MVKAHQYPSEYWLNTPSLQKAKAAVPKSSTSLKHFVDITPFLRVSLSVPFACAPNHGYMPDIEE